MEMIVQVQSTDPLWDRGSQYKNLCLTPNRRGLTKKCEDNVHFSLKILN